MSPVMVTSLMPQRAGNAFIPERRFMIGCRSESFDPCRPRHRSPRAFRAGAPHPGVTAAASIPRRGGASTLNPSRRRTYRQGVRARNGPSTHCCEVTMQAREFMTSRVATVRPDNSISDAGRLLLERDVTALPVVDADGRLVGIVSRSDLVKRRVTSDPRAHLIPISVDDSEPPHCVADVMTTDLVTLSPGSDEAEATKLMLDHHVKSLPIVSDGRLVGMVSVTDILRSKLRGDAEIEGDVRSRLEQFKAADEAWSVCVE